MWNFPQIISRKAFSISKRPQLTYDFATQTFPFDKNHGKI